MTTAGRNRANDPNRHGLARGWLPAFGIAIATIAIQLPIFDRWFSVMDEGHMLLFADQLNQGRLLYRDMTIYPLPGSFYGLALVFSLFEPSILVSRWVVVIEFGLFVALIWSWMRRLVSPAWALSAVVAMWVYRVWSFPHWQMYSYSTTALLLLLASFVALLGHFERRRVSSLWLAGGLFGLGVFCKQDYGAAALVASIVALVTFARSDVSVTVSRTLGHFLLPAAAVGGLAGVHFLVQGQLGTVVQMTVWKHFVGLSTYEYQAFPSLLPVFRQDPALRDLAGIHNNLPALLTTVTGADVLASRWFRETALYDTAAKLFIYGPWAFLAAGALWLWRRREELTGRPSAARLAELLLFSFATALVVLAHTYRPQDYVHIAVLYWPLICLGLLYTADGLRQLQGARVARWACAAALTISALAFTMVTAHLAWQLRVQNDTEIPLERAGVYARAEQANLLAEIVEYLRVETEPDEAVAVLPYFSIVHFLAERFGPHASSYILWPFPEYPDRDQRIVDAMEARGTKTVIYNFTQFPNFPPVPQYAPVLFDYLVNHFESDRVWNDTALGFKLAALRRESGGDLGRPLIGDLDSASLTFESDRGDARRLDAPERSASLAVEVWPFRPVLAIRPGVGGAHALRIAIDVPVAARLRTAIGTHPDVWFRFPPAWVRFEIAAHVDGQRRTLFERTLDPHQVLADRGWFEVDLSLAELAGRRVEIELSTRASSREGADLRMGGFGEPRIVTEEG